MNTFDYPLNTVLTFKKKHPCGSFEFTIIQTGVTYKLKCNGCGREIIIARADISKYIRK